MSIIHSKNTIGVLQGPSGRNIPALIKYYKFGGSSGTQSINRKGKDIAEALRAQGEILIEFRAYFERSDVPYMTLQAFIEGLSITFSAILLQRFRNTEFSQTISEDFQQPARASNDGLLFRAFGFLDESEIVAEAGDYVLIRGVLRASEIVIGKLLL